MKFLNLTALLVLCSSSLAFSDSVTYSISDPNSALSGDVGPFGTVTIDLTSSTQASITFSSQTNGGYIYLIGAANSFDVNVNSSDFTASTPPVFTNLSGFTSSLVNYGSGNVSAFGNFNLTGTLFDSFTHAATSVQFTLTNNSGIWASAQDVLVANSNGYLVAMHAIPCPGGALSCTTSSIPGATGFAAGSSPIIPVPEPGTWLLLGSALFAGSGLLKYKKGAKENVH